MVKYELYSYMSLNYNEVEQQNVPEPLDRVVTKENFKAMQPILFPDSVGDEELMTREWRLRDFDDNGYMDWWEYEKYIWHYNHMTSFWNEMKIESLDVDRPPYQPVDPMETMTMEEWLSQNNPWLRREYSEDAVIPDQ